MAETATTDAVITAYFASNGVCDKIEAASNVKASTLTRLSELDAKHAAGTALNSRDKMFMVTALQEYLMKA